VKRYYIIMRVNEQSFGMDVLAKSEPVARNKAVKRASRSLKQAVTHDHIVSVEYTGFYLNRMFVPAKYVWIAK
jgi:hypothetical protein